MANRSKRKRTALQGLLILLVLAGLFPAPVTCGALTATCMPAPDPQGYVSVYYEVEPLFVALLETVLTVNLPLKYYSGHHRYQIIAPTNNASPTEETGKIPLPRLPGKHLGIRIPNTLSLAHFPPNRLRTKAPPMVYFML